MAFASPKGSLECSLNNSLPLSHSLLRFFWANGCCFRKGSVEGSANYSLHLSPKLLYKSSLEGSANCALHLSPSVLLGSKLRELFTCLTHTNPVRRKQPIMSLLLGYSLGLFFIIPCKGGVLRDITGHHPKL